MDDIAGLTWTSTQPNGAKPATANYAALAALKPTPPASGRASPFSQTASQPASKPATPANDSFASLVSFGPSASQKNLSLLEQQKRRSEAKPSPAPAAQGGDQYIGGDDHFWDNLGRGRSSNAAPAPSTDQAALGEHDDIFAAFNQSAGGAKQAVPVPSRPDTGVEAAADDDDPFELSRFAAPRPTTAARPRQDGNDLELEDDDDVLGLLGKPASTQSQHQPQPKPTPTPHASSPEADGPPPKPYPQDQAVAELVEMGFPADKAKHALETTESGTDVQAAVGFLLTQAHAETRQRTHSMFPTDRDGQSAVGQPRRPARPPWDEAEDARRRPRGSVPTVERDFEQMATDFGANFLKTAGSLWKQSTKRVQQAVQDFNSDSDSAAQPRWMKDPDARVNHESPRRPRPPEARPAEPRSAANMTDEAMMLEGSRPTPPPRPSAASRVDRPFDSSADISRDHSPAVPSRPRQPLPSKQPAFLAQSSAPGLAGTKATLNRAAADEQAAHAYVSSARRRKPATQTQPQATPSDGDLLEGTFRDAPSGPSRPVNPSPQGPPPATTNPSSRPPPQAARRNKTETPVRPAAPPRTIPSVSADRLAASHADRDKGNEHFKRGDYAAAHQAYASSMAQLPATHPLIIVLLTNHALTALKVGEPKNAIAAADQAMTLVGPAKGDGETVDFGTGAPGKPMRDYYGKALMRKAEALEQMERWTDAAAVWREAVEGGHGGATSMQGRLRAEKAAHPSPAPKAAPATSRTPAASAAPPTRRAAAAVTSTAPAAAVSRLRAANLAAEQADDERFRLADAVDARILAWKGGKADNLRALLASLETALWDGSGWKKINMADLVLPAKVKIQYMKGIGKVHPDKIPTDATTEERMIAGAVFSTLNEAWDKFKTENNL